MFTASQLWMPGAVFSNTLLSLKLALKVVSKSTHNFFHRASMLTNVSKIHVYSLKTMDARVWPRDCIFQHLIEPEACPEGGIKKYPQRIFIELVY